MTGAAFERSNGPVVVSPRDEQRQITTVDEWLEWAGPLGGEKQWADGRSAKEVAKAWCRPDGKVGWMDPPAPDPAGANTFLTTITAG